MAVARGVAPSGRCVPAWPTDLDGPHGTAPSSTLHIDPIVRGCCGAVVGDGHNDGDDDDDMDGKDTIEVWVEIFTGSDGSQAASADDVKSAARSHFRLGRASYEAYMAADLMRKAQESRRAAETVVAASTAISNGQRHRSVDAALAKLKTIKKTHKDSVAENDIRLVVMLNDSGEEHHVRARRYLSRHT